MHTYAEFPTKREGIRVKSVTLHDLNGRRVYDIGAALNEYEAQHGSEFSFYLQRLVSSADQEFGSVNDLRPSFRKVEGSVNDYVLSDDLYFTFEHYADGVVRIRVKKKSKSFIDSVSGFFERQIIAMELHYAKLKATEAVS